MEIAVKNALRVSIVQCQHRILLEETAHLHLQ